MTIPTCPNFRSSIPDRFWKKVLKSEGCWNWMAGHFTTPNGVKSYGCLWAGDKKSGTGRMIAAHIISWQLENGSFPKGMKICHKCDNPSCVRPSHLFLGTQLDNVRDMIRKGRANKARGSKHHKAKLTESDVASIRKQRKSGIKRTVLAKKYGVCEHTITQIMNRDIWKHVP